MIDFDFDRHMNAKRSAIDAWRSTFTADGMLKVPGRDWHTITVTRSTRPGVLYQVTRWDMEDGSLVPLGHIDITTGLESALEELWWMAKREVRS